jgi:tRNA 2-thiouridine synthesizing protein A
MTRSSSTCHRVPRINAIMTEVDRELDTRGLNCPLPILKAKKALAEMASGQLLKVVSTDSGSVRDFQAFARQTGNELVEQNSTGPDYTHVLRRR